MRVIPLLLWFAAGLSAQNVEQKLKWARETIDAHAVTRQFEPPSKSSGTKWQVTKIDGCTVELKETAHREAPDSVFTHEGVFDLAEEKVVIWSFDLGNLRPEFVMADTSIGAPHLKIFALGDAFHQNTEAVMRTLRKDGTTATTSKWSTPGSTRNLWIYFDSPTIDNKPLVQRLELDLRDAIHDCSHQR
jgi:hypothetical protein